MVVRPTPQQRAEMAAFIDYKEPGLLDDLGVSRTVCGTVRAGHVCHEPSGHEGSHACGASACPAEWQT